MQSSINLVPNICIDASLFAPSFHGQHVIGLSNVSQSCRFFVVSNSPMQFILSQGSTVMGTLGSGSELEVNGSTTFGVEQFITFNLTKGMP